MAETTQSTQTLEATDEINALRVSPAAHLTEEMATATKAGGRAVGLRERAFTVQIGLRCTPGTASADALESALGITLPKQVGEVTGDGTGLHTIWLSPDEFLAVDVSRQQRPGETLVAEAALEGLPGQAVDLSANRTIIELTGSKAREVLEKSVRADLHPRAFGVGTALVTQLGPVPVILHHSSEGEYRVYPRASFADFTVRWLLDGMAEFVADDARAPADDSESTG
ncbi:sarcosine oxidase subunit gamma [Brevibacterium aurantiacum]|uniref:Sarcosine oxidase subunit gamma n=1 Tax=Brevibacterium aurantiacum TaxID=273384 RepID=A0A556CDP0_BREAU|nr:sarcosine oxidase subunit gamma family protein [Brevibacterium aurantiacum]TSI15554.1 sarcosine oxidase subunit gamma [Brevibacterium aurantiacum]